MSPQEIKQVLRWLSELEEGGSKGLRAFLLEVQRSWNWVPPQCLAMAAEHLEIALGTVHETASLMSSISLEKQGETVIAVCLGMACSDAHSADILTEAEKCLEIKEGTTTADGKITLKKHFCFGHCAIGPNVKINQEFSSNQSPASIRTEIVKRREKDDK